MRTRYLAGGLLAATLLSTTAIAQTNPPPVTPPAATAPAMTQGAHWRASKLIGVNIYNEQNDKLGDISEIIMDPAGKVMGYVIGVGGFLGMGEHNVLVEPTAIKFVNEPMRTTTTTTTTNPPAAGAPMNTRPVSNTAPRAANEKWYPDHGVMSATKDQLKAMAQFKY